MNRRELILPIVDPLFQKLHPRFKNTGCRGSVENQIADGPPLLSLVLAADDADGSLKRFPVQPQFAVEWHIGETSREPVRRVIQIPLTRQELLAIPERS